MPLSIDVLYYLMTNIIIQINSRIMIELKLDIYEQTWNASYSEL